MQIIKRIEEATGAHIRDVDNWIIRLPLHTEFDTGGRGRARRYTFENALEIALISDLTRIGIRASRAASFAYVLIANEEEHRGFDKAWAVTDGDLETLKSIDPDDLLNWSRETLEAARTFAVIQPGKIRARIQAYFDVHATDEDVQRGLR